MFSLNPFKLLESYREIKHKRKARRFARVLIDTYLTGAEREMYLKWSPEMRWKFWGYLVKEGIKLSKAGMLDTFNTLALGTGLVKEAMRLFCLEGKSQRMSNDPTL